MSKKKRQSFHAEDEEIPFTLQKPLYQFSWENATKHHCGVCWKKIRHSCIGTHAVNCRMYHGSLFIKGQEDNCKDCRKSREALEVRVRGIADLGKLLASPSKTASSIGNTLQSPFKGSRREKKAAKRENKARSHQGTVVTEKEIAAVRELLIQNLAQASGYALDSDLARDNMAVLNDTCAWRKPITFGNTAVRKHTAILTAMEISCRAVMDDQDKCRILQTLDQRIGDCDTALTLERERTSRRKADFERLLSRKAAQALQERHENVGNCPTASDKQLQPTVGNVTIEEKSEDLALERTRVHLAEAKFKSAGE